MSSSSAVIATAASQYRNGYISAVLNKNNPYTAMSFIENMLALIPPKLLENAIKDDPAPEAPEKIESWTEDPDSMKGESEAWRYCYKKANWVERQLAKVTYDIISGYRSGG